MVATATRIPGIELLKALASQFILLHHLSAYGPLSEAAGTFAPDLTGWLFEYGRMAVQVFLVAGGFLAARGLARGNPASGAFPLGRIARRSLRLSVPYCAALGLAVAGSAIADAWMDDDAIPTRPSAGRALAHVLMLQDILGYQSLMAGAWYIPIDLQLFSLTALLLWVGRSAVFGRVLVLGLAAASLLAFNRNPRWDVWAVYFLGSYGLGAAAWWSSSRERSLAWMGGIAMVAGIALALDFRLRIAIALAVAVGLTLGVRSGALERWPRSRPADFLGRISFSLFLVHFPVVLLINAAYVQSGLEAPVGAVAALFVAWLASIGVATVFHRFVEGPVASGRFQSGLERLAPRLARAFR